MTKLSLYDVLNHGAIVAHDVSQGIIITVNPQEFRAFIYLPDGRFVPITWVVPLSAYYDGQGMHGVSAGELIDKANELLRDHFTGGN